MDAKEKLKLDSIFLKGYKSINSEGQKIVFNDITIFLGANGAGKSNLVSFFKMLNYITTGSLQVFIGENGSADSFLYYGSKKTSRIEALISFVNSSVEDTYKFILSHAAGDTLIFNEETLTWLNKEKGYSNPFVATLDPGGKESNLNEKIKLPREQTAKVVHALLRSCQVFQFHDTSSTSRLRNNVYIEDSRYLKSDGGNLAAFLYMLKIQEEQYYNKIVRYVQRVMPQFGDFDLLPSTLNKKYITLNWKEQGNDYLFGPHQISDGSLRFMCLATLLLQPPKYLPSVIILDEPELGLHPSAIAILAGMARTTSRHCQIVMATQSPRFLDEFGAENIVIVERESELNSGFSKYSKLDEEKLSEWQEQYSLSELWEKNVLGGQP